jgi:hypothetical protein
LIRPPENKTDKTIALTILEMSSVVLASYLSSLYYAWWFVCTTVVYLLADYFRDVKGTHEGYEPSLTFPKTIFSY